MALKRKWVITFCFFVALCSQSFGQDEPPSDSLEIKALVGGKVSTDSIKSDPTKIIEDAALDIAQNRGLFIFTPDGSMQMRILGSVRYLVVYDGLNLPTKNDLVTIEIPTGENNIPFPNYYNELAQSRLGFEVTRRTDRGNVFARLETDFAGQYGFRIRHAYGQFKSLLVGQTWSLFAHIAALPATVDFGGPTGSIAKRNPQIRFTSNTLIPSFNFSVGLEYSRPEIFIPDSLAIEAFQLVPDITLRIKKKTEWGSFQLSGIMPVLSGKTDGGNTVFQPGWGVGFSAIINSWASGKWYLQAAGGKAISRYFGVLGGKGLDVVYDEESKEYFIPISFGGFVTYEHYWKEHIFSSIAYGIVTIENISAQAINNFQFGSTTHFNTFWEIVEGARLGVEYELGLRIDRSGERGWANRFNALFYYDF